MNTAILSLREAAKLAQKTKPTLLNHIKKGKLSGVKDEFGQWKINIAELERVYDLRKTSKNPLSEKFNAINHPVLQDELHIKIAVYEERIKHLETALAKSEKSEDDLKNLLNQNTKLLTHYTEQEKTEEAKPTRKGWLFSR